MSKRHWLPDLALVLSLLTLFHCLFVFDGWRQLFRDSDTGWHIRTGEVILRTHALPTSDPYSFSRGGQQWFAWEWAADACMAVAHGVAGLAGVALLYALAIAAATWLWVRLCWQCGADFLTACLAAIPMLSTVNLHWLARPHIFGWLLLMAAVLLASRPVVSVNPRGALLVALLSAVWTNVHASFFLLPVTLLLFAAGQFLEEVLYGRSGNAKALSILGLIAACASLANPYGWQVHLHVFRYLADSELIDRIGEYQSFNFHAAGAGQILLGLGLTALGGALALTQGKIAQALWIAMLAALALRSARGLPIAALAALPFALGAISHWLLQGAGAQLRPDWRTRLAAAMAYSIRLRALDRAFSGLALVPFVLALLVVVAKGTRAAGFPADQFPLEAAKHLPANGRLLAPDKFGGYLIYASGGERKVFFDGRSDFYGSGFMKRYIKLVEVRPGWREELDSWNFTHALLPNQYSLIPALQQLGWQTTYRDQVATILAKRDSSPE